MWREPKERNHRCPKRGFICAHQPFGKLGAMSKVEWRHLRTTNLPCLARHLPSESHFRMLREYRTPLIPAAMTGKIDVRGFERLTAVPAETEMTNGMADCEVAAGRQE